jgi:hypothetical protein
MHRPDRAPRRRGAEWPLCTEFAHAQLIAGDEDLLEDVLCLAAERVDLVEQAQLQQLPAIPANCLSPPTGRQPTTT